MRHCALIAYSANATQFIASEKMRTAQINIAAFSERLLDYRRAKSLNQEELATKLGVSLRMLQYWEEGKHAPGAKNLRKASEFLGVSLDTLLGRSAAASPWELNEAAPPWPGPGAARRVPVYHWSRLLRGGIPGETEQPSSEYIECESADPGAYGLIVEGDSMHPEIKPSDRVVLLPHREARNGDIVLAVTQPAGDVYLRLFHRTGKAERIVALTSYNPAYPRLEFDRAEFRFIHPLERVVRKLRKAGDN